MATVKKGILTDSPEWWKHLRKTKRAFWKRERRAAKREGEKQACLTTSRRPILAGVLTDRESHPRSSA